LEDATVAIWGGEKNNNTVTITIFEGIGYKNNVTVIIFIWSVTDVTFSA
jgi:hypothetical protein